MRTIYCHKCGAYLGEIRDAKLMKGIAHICPDCLRQKQSAHDLPPDFAKIFGMR